VISSRRRFESVRELKVTTRRPIFASGEASQTIGYFDGEGAYDLSGRLRCRYNEVTGNLSDPETGKIVGHISLEGRFVGLSWLAAELFPSPTMDLVQAASSSDQPVEVQKERFDSSDADIERALEMVRAALGKG
jgi:hypothetical protein